MSAPAGVRRRVVERSMINRPCACFSLLGELLKIVRIKELTHVFRSRSRPDAFTGSGVC